ncbi:CarD family transcriptional regulator [Candidatus Paracaedimonas acanthamoebae]|nr:CarD family transcriptional regulator [Candidatus Paracaedimonas acanthamoebae]
MIQSRAFSSGDLVVYPAHGVGKVMSIETQEVAGHELQVFVISFSKNRMTLRLPMKKAQDAGLRALSTENEVEKALGTLKKKIKSKKAIWSRRAQEYEMKISSGELTSIAEVIRELYRSGEQPDQSYSERQIYQAALQRLASEIAAIEAIDENQAIARVEEILQAA